MMTFFATILISLSANAAVHDDSQLELLIHARTGQELTEKTVLSRALEELKSRCEVQVSVLQVPISCFAEAQLKLREKIITLSDFSRREKQLVHICRQISRNSRDWRSLQAALTSELPESCRIVLQKRIDDLSYQAGDVRKLDQILK